MQLEMYTLFLEIAVHRIKLPEMNVAEKQSLKNCHKKEEWYQCWSHFECCVDPNVVVRAVDVDEHSNVVQYPAVAECVAVAGCVAVVDKEELAPHWLSSTCQSCCDCLHVRGCYHKAVHRWNGCP